MLSGGGGINLSKMIIRHDEGSVLAFYTYENFSVERHLNEIERVVASLAVAVDDDRACQAPESSLQVQ